MHKVLGAAAVAAFLPVSAMAAPVTFFGENETPGGTVSGDPATARASFLAALAGGVGTEDFESFNVGDPAPLALSFPGSTGAITATLVGPTTDIGAGGGAGRFATSGTQYVETEGGGDFTISFSAPIAAFGFYGTDLGDIGNDLVITLTDTNADETSFTLDLSGAPSGALMFWGFVDSMAEYTTIEFDNTPGSGDFFGFDDMTIGDAGQVRLQVSEPGALALFGLGLAGLGFAARRRRKAG